MLPRCWIRALGIVFFAPLFLGAQGASLPHAASLAGAAEADAPKIAVTITLDGRTRAPNGPWRFYPGDNAASLSLAPGEATHA